jgi:hypothetical protein
MPPRRRCPQGHHWDEERPVSSGVGASLRCPTCGLAAVEDDEEALARIFHGWLSMPYNHNYE